MVTLFCSESAMAEKRENPQIIGDVSDKNANLVKSGTGWRENRIRDKIISKKPHFSNKKTKKCAESPMMTMGDNNESQNIPESVLDRGNPTDNFASILNDANNRALG